MDKEEIRILISIGLCILLLGFLIGMVIFSNSPESVEIKNEIEKDIINAEMETDYPTYLQAEKDLRSFLASYESDKITYISNKDNADNASQQLANAAKTRANRTAATYNQLLKQTLYQKVELPDDLKNELEYIE